MHVNPVLMTDTMHDAKLDMKIVVGPDEIELKKKQAQHLAQGTGNGVPVYVNPTVMKNEMHDADLELKDMKVGGNTVSAAQKQGVPVHVNPVLMTDTMHDAKLDMKIRVGPDDIELKKKQMQQLVQQISKKSKFSEMKESDLEEIMKKQMLAAPTKAASQDEAKKTLDDAKAVEEALGKRILDRLTGYGWVYGYPLYPYVPYGSPLWYDLSYGINSIYAYQDWINRYEAANAVAAAAAPGIYEALKNALAPPPADSKSSNSTAPAKASLIQLPDLDDTVVLQVNGVPVTVNPESMIVANTEAATPLGLTNMVIGPDEVSVAQKKATKDIDDKEMKDSIVQFNQKLAELKKKFKF